MNCCKLMSDILFTVYSCPFALNHDTNMAQQSVFCGVSAMLPSTHPQESQPKNETDLSRPLALKQYFPCYSNAIQGLNLRYTKSVRLCYPLHWRESNGVIAWNISSRHRVDTGNSRLPVTSVQLSANLAFGESLSFNKYSQDCFKRTVDLLW